MTSLLRRGSAALAVLLFSVFVLPLSSARAATPTDSALDWLSRELTTNGHQLGFKGAPSFTDWGLTIDFVLALAGGGRAGAAETQATVSNVTANATSYVTDGSPGSSERYAGPMGKLLYMTKVFGVDSSNLGGLNIEAELRALMQTTGSAQPGRFSDHSAFGDFSNGFGQAFDVLGLARTGGGVPPEAIAFLLAQQCREAASASSTTRTRPAGRTTRLIPTRRASRSTRSSGSPARRARSTTPRAGSSRTKTRAARSVAPVPLRA